ncbi:MAG: hypothetical protein K5886_08500 [Lachnospiraceae bacterium]|nr:hypothetical protein [Lachnospiraceae bacterium]
MEIRQFYGLTKRILIFFPILIFVVFTNYYIDSASVYHDASSEIAKAMADGHSVIALTDNTNEREIKRNLIADMPDEVDCVALGPSYIFGVNREATGEDSFYNLAVSGADCYDILAQLGMLKGEGKSVKRVLFCVDTRFFDPEYYTTNVRNEPLMPYTEYMLETMDGKEVPFPSLSKIPAIKNGVKQLFSLSYFQNCMKKVMESGRYHAESERYEILSPDREPDRNYYHPDGSLSHESNSESSGVERVKENAFQYDIGYFFRYDKIDERSKKMFLDMIGYLTAQGIEVDLFLCPVSPFLWDRIEAEGKDNSLFSLMEELALQTADEYSLKITGGYDPYAFALSNEDFTDAMHMKHAVLNSVFDLSGKDKDQSR